MDLFKFLFFVPCEFFTFGSAKRMPIFRQFVAGSKAMQGILNLADWLVGILARIFGLSVEGEQGRQYRHL